MKAMLATLALLLPSVSEAAPCTGPTCNLATLAPYFARLAHARAAPGQPPVHIVQIGDSHSAGDVMTAAWRDLLQARFGDGGRGILPPGRPYTGYLTHGITATMSPGWRIATTVGSGAAEPRPPLGLTSYTLTATASGATMGLTADPGHPFDRFTVCTVAPPPGNGELVVRIGAGTTHQLGSDALRSSPYCATLRAPTPQVAVTLTASDASVAITSWATFRDMGGVALSNLGVVGSQLVHLGRTDDAVLREELRSYVPDLIVLAFGTNEGFVPRFDAIAYEATLRAQIARIRRLVPGVPLLLLGPPDALTRNPALRSNAVSPAIDCADPNGGALLFAPPALGEVRRIQRNVAIDLDLAWWDWQQRMGGPCAAVGWAAAEPALMRTDHVHFRDRGGAVIARLLQDDLDRAALEAR